jgi:hypothetical protein
MSERKGSVQQVNKDFAHNIKASHFEYGNGRPPTEIQKANHYKSLTTASYNHKGNAISLKAKLDQAKKDDLRSNHFTIGGPSAAIKRSTSQLSFQPATKLQSIHARPTLNAEK